MNKLVILMSAAGALLPASAMAQRTASPPVRWEDTPHVQMRMPMAPMQAAPAAAPMNWHGPAPHGQIPPPPPPPNMRPYLGPHGPMGQNMGQNMGMHRGGDRMMMRHHGSRNFARYQRFNRGGFLPQTWWGPQFQVVNWGGYGLPQPMPGCRWIRYYDDALMVDGSGRIRDGRWGMGWDQWQDDWDYGDDGAPYYVGGGDYYDRGGFYSGMYPHEGGGFMPPPPPPGYGAPCAQTCTSTYAYPGYGYGWGWGGGAVVTETTVTTSPTIVTETYYEEEVVHQRARSKGCKCRVKAKPRYHRPIPQPGERG